MASNMELTARRCFPKANRVIDRLDVEKLAAEALQKIRVVYRWQTIEQENKEMALAKQTKEDYIPLLLENGDTHKFLCL